MKKYKYCILPLFIIILIYTIMYNSTNIVINDFKKIICNEPIESIVKDSALYDSYTIEHQSNKNLTYADVEIKRIAVLHNFHKGYMLVNYSYERYDHNNRINGSWNIYSTWTIRKQNGRWIVTDIKERP